MRIARAAEYENNYEDATQAYQFAGKLALKVVEVTVGKQVNITASIRNQTDVPRLTTDQQQKLLEGFERAGVNVDDYVEAIIVGEMAPQTSEAAYGVPDLAPDAERTRAT